MTRLRLLLALGVAFILLLLGLSAGMWWYLFGENEVDAAELVPANTIAYATIPNAAAIVAGYQTSNAKTLLDSPNIKPLQDAITNLIGQKNLDLLQTFLPNLSGQSFIAVTHFDYNHPEQVGLIAGMKPKAGLEDFDAFLAKLKATWPDVIKQGKTGTGNVEGLDYAWIQRPGAPDKICVAHFRGWIITTWGEASLQDWLERFRKKSSTSNLAEDLDYRKTLAAVGDAPMTLLYINNRALVDILQKQVEKNNPTLGDYLAKKLQLLGGAALATRFENGEIVDRFSFLVPRPAQLDCGMGVDPCPFDTLKFTGPQTRFYWASSINWQQYYRHLKEQPEITSYSPYSTTNLTTTTKNFLASLRSWAVDAGLDPQLNIVNALGSEFSVQAEWSSDTLYPEVGLFVKLDKPDDFKPTIKAIIESVRKTYLTSAVINEINLNGQNFAALKFVQPSLISPTITEDGPYLGVFLTESQAVRSFERDPSLGLTHRADFNRQVGDKRNGAAQVLFLDSPYLLDRAYKTALPYLSIAEMFNKNLAAMLKGRDMPDDLAWLAPIGTWSCVITPDEDGIQGRSVSGIGNQEILLSCALGGTAGVLQSMGLLPKTMGAPGTVSTAGTPPVPSPTLNPLGAPAGNPLFPPLPPPPVLADSTTSGPTSTAPTAIIYITSQNKLFFDTTPVPDDQFGDFLKARKAENQELKLFVHMDRNASQDELALVMDAGAHAGFGVLSYTYTSGADSSPSAATTNLASASVPANSPATNAAPSGSNSVSAPAVPTATTNSAPTNFNATPPNPAPPAAQ